jgi:hypothetical protein
VTATPAAATLRVVLFPTIAVMGVGVGIGFMMGDAQRCLLHTSRVR